MDSLSEEEQEEMEITPEEDQGLQELQALPDLLGTLKPWILRPWESISASLPLHSNFATNVLKEDYEKCKGFKKN
ncbi:UNVERIFIED_CONTAM: hypothetical protein K2H54_059577 [Gekko kuhli]